MKGDLRPFEIIDGQHRLWAFDQNINEGFELPVVAFYDLDIAWQAYLFWSINVSPKRINPSHAFDLYPLLRSQQWLKGVGDLNIYREARSQEITEWMYKYKDSAWHNRINMLGEVGRGKVSQAAIVRSLTAAFFGTGRGKGGRRGLFQANVVNDEPLNWDRSQQIALILKCWMLIRSEIEATNEIEWIKAFRGVQRSPFEDKASMLNQDMGVRAIHAVVNDLLVENAENWGLDEWIYDSEDKTNTTDIDIKAALNSLVKERFYEYLKKLIKNSIQFDWRSLEGPGVRVMGEAEGNKMEAEKARMTELEKRAYRGSGGYTLLTRDLKVVMLNTK